MKKMSLYLQGLINAVLAAAYVSLIALIMSHGENIFGKEDGFLVPFIMLLIFVLSAAVMGILVFAKPIMLYIDGQKKDAVKLLGYTVGWISVVIIITILLKIAI
ncbi:MAG TPA: hypothetical protein P5096_03245 [Patescibacteria group bacterium]|nr:hypothetical protein [Patescibacteria group bacterium]